MNNSATFLVILGLSGILCTPTQATTEYTIASVGEIGGTYIRSFGLNINGQVVGDATNASGQHQAFLSTNGVMTDLGTLGGSASEALGINDSGEVVGDADTSSGTFHAFLYSGGTMHDIGTLPAPYNISSVATAIDNAGQVVGYCASSAGNYEAFLYSGSTMLYLGALCPGAPTYTYTQAQGINNLGQVVGWYGDYWSGFLYSNGTASILSPPPGYELYSPVAINDSGAIAGNADYGSDGVYHAFLSVGGVMTDLGPSFAWGIGTHDEVVGSNYGGTGGGAFLYTGGAMEGLNSLVPAGYSLYEAEGINARGQICASGSSGAYLLTPLPEPSAIGLLCAGAVGLLAYGCRRRRQAA
jgi:probable HAF family extracellular repeat protein